MYVCAYICSMYVCCRDMLVIVYEHVSMHLCSRMYVCMYVCMAQVVN